MQIRAQFESSKNDDAVQRRFDLREHQKAIDARNALALSTAESFQKVVLHRPKRLSLRCIRYDRDIMLVTAPHLSQSAAWILKHACLCECHAVCSDSWHPDPALHGACLHTKA